MAEIPAPRDERIGLADEMSHDEASLADDRDVHAPALPVSLSLGSYDELDVVLDPDRHTLWCTMQPKGVPAFTPSLLHDLNTLHKVVGKLSARSTDSSELPIRFYVGCSDAPGIFNLGGDLAFFLDRIKRKDKPALTAYAHACVEALYNNASGFGLPVVSICVVEGDALGGGLEAALSFNVLIAERGTKMGLPEVLFNSFPGMGAYSFLSRKLDARRAEKIILSGRVYSAEEFFEMGIVDVLADKGDGRNAARKFIAENARRHMLLHALNKVRRRIVPLTLEELLDVTDIWVDTAINLTTNDLHRIEILLSAQRQRLARAQAAPNPR